MARASQAYENDQTPTATHTAIFAARPFSSRVFFFFQSQELIYYFFFCNSCETFKICREISSKRLSYSDFSPYFPILGRTIPWDAQTKWCFGNSAFPRGAIKNPPQPILMLILHLDPDFTFYFFCKFHHAHVDVTKKGHPYLDLDFTFFNFTNPTFLTWYFFYKKSDIHIRYAFAWIFRFLET